MKYLKDTWIAGGIIVIAVILCITSVWNDSLIVDEIPHVGSGYSYVSKFDMRLNPEHPPLPKALATLPLLFLNLNEQAFTINHWETEVNGQWNFGRRLIYDSGNNATTITRLVKIPMLLFFILSSIVMFVWMKGRYGSLSALIALTIFAFSPTVIAHARFVTTDVPALTGVLVGTYFFVLYSKHASKKTFWLASLAFGFALLTKFSVILLVPFFFVLAILWALVSSSTEQRWNAIYHSVLRTIKVCLVGFVVVVWPVYFVLSFNYPPARQKSDVISLLGPNPHQSAAKVIVWMADKPFLRSAAEYGTGLLMVVHRSEGGNRVYFRETTYEKTAGRIYFPYVYFIKEPLAWWGMVLIAVAGALVVLQRRAPGPNIKNWVHKHFDEVAMILWLALYWFISIRSTLNIGVRHLLPAYPFAIMLVSASMAALLRNANLKVKKYLIVALSILLVWYVAENIRVFPHYLTYFNQSVGGPQNGYRHVVDSNLDWGQDLKRFSDWVIASNIDAIELDYFGWANPTFYMKERFLWLTATKFKDRKDFVLRNTSNGWIAISATFLMNELNDHYTWLADEKPVEVIGNSIFVYRITP